jgi:hypothetical protein
MAITFIEGADMSEAKTPLPGEYWVSDDGSLIRIVGVKLNGGVIYENQAGFSFQFNSMIQWRHEPRCTGFDWVEPKLLTPGEGYELLPVGTVLECGDEFLIGKEWVMTGNYGEDYSVLRNTYRRKIKPVESWPKYYRGDNWCSINAYVRFDDEYHEAIWVAADGTERVFYSERYHTVPDRIAENSWREITEAEAKARVKPVVRRIDTEGRDVTEEHGLHDESDSIVERIPMRLWVSSLMASDAFACVYARRDGQTPEDCEEILWDANGFYVTKGER